MPVIMPFFLAVELTGVIRALGYVREINLRRAVETERAHKQYRKVRAGYSAPGE